MGGLTFRPELAAAVMAGKKTETRRVPKDNPQSPWFKGGCAFKRDRDYAVQPGRGKTQIGRALIVEDPRLVFLGNMRDETARREGVGSLAEFKDLWRDLHGSWDAGQKVWALRFIPFLRYRIVVPPVGLGYQRNLAAADIEQVRELLERHPHAWAIDNEVRREVSRSQIGCTA